MTPIYTTRWTPLDEKEILRLPVITRRFVALVCEVLNMLHPGVGTNNIKKLLIVGNKLRSVDKLITEATA